MKTVVNKKPLQTSEETKHNTHDVADGSLENKQLK
jgi:hypothetical protein